MFPEESLYHYKYAHKEADLLKFKNKQTRILIAVDALNQGLNIPDIDGAICMAFTSTELTFIQQIARITRKMEGKRMPVFINLFYEGTVEETWLNKKSENINSVCLTSSHVPTLLTILSHEEETLDMT